MWYLTLLSVWPAPSSSRAMGSSVPTEPPSWSLSRRSSCWSSTWDNTSWEAGPTPAVPVRTRQTCRLFILLGVVEEGFKVGGGGSEVDVVPVSLTGRLSMSITDFNPPCWSKSTRAYPEYSFHCLILKVLAGNFCPQALLEIRTVTRRECAAEMSLLLSMKETRCSKLLSVLRAGLTVKVRGSRVWRKTFHSWKMKRKGNHSEIRENSCSLVPAC